MKGAERRSSLESGPGTVPPKSTHRQRGLPFRSRRAGEGGPQLKKSDLSKSDIGGIWQESDIEAPRFSARYVAVRARDQG